MNWHLLLWGAIGGVIGAVIAHALMRVFRKR